MFPIPFQKVELLIINTVLPVLIRPEVSEGDPQERQ